MHSIVSYPNRGPWGDASYPGNCSGHLVRGLIRHFRPKFVADPTEGSGTTKAVCASLGVNYWGSDLKEGFDLTAEPLLTALPWTPELVFLHPPYFKIIRYSGKVWGDRPDCRDLSQVDDWQEYLKRLYTMIEHCRSALTKGGHLAILIGDVAESGSYYSSQASILRWYPPELVEAMIIKAQHHVRSDQTEYSSNIIRIMHEYCIVLRAPGGGRAAP